MPRYAFKLPDIGEGITQAEIACWRVAVGDKVTEDQPLADMLTEKAAVEIPSPVAGTVVELIGSPGDYIAVGAVLLSLETGDAAAVTDAPATTLPPGASAKRAALNDAGLVRTGERPQAAPSVRKRARELGVDLAHVRSSREDGRITHGDLDAHTALKAKPVAVPAPASAARQPAPLPFAGEDEIEQIKLIGLRRKIAEAMQRSKQRIPHFAYVEEVDVTELEALRNHLNGRRGEDRPKLTLLPFLMRALVQAVPQHPEVNATFDDEAGIVYRHSALHVGIATQTPGGLVVPVVHYAERLDLWRSAWEIKRLADAARSSRATREELSGSTITISSLGAIGGIASTPVINAPEVAILGVNKIVERPVYRNGQLVPRLLMNLSSSFDHRIVDGWNAAQFIQSIKNLLEHPAALFLT